MHRKYQVDEVFTPSSPARVTFVERNDVRDKLSRALKTRGKQIVVYGHSGSGKSTLVLNKLHQLYEDHISTNCMKGMTFEHIVLNAFDKLDPFFKESKAAESTRKVAASVTAEYQGIKSAIDVSLSKSTTDSYARALPPQLSAQRLGEFLGEARCCWMLEDFHKVEEGEKRKVAQAMKVFMDMSSTYPDLKIVALGAVDTARQVIDCDPEMRNRVAEVPVSLMTKREIEQIIKKGEAALRVRIPKDIVDDIVIFSNGLAAIAHQLCLNLCHAVDIFETLEVRYPFNRDDFDIALQSYISDESDSIKKQFEIAVLRKRKSKYDNCKLILDALAASESMDGMTRAELLERIRSTHPTYPDGNLTTYVRELASSDRNEMLRVNKATGTISYNNPFHKAFAQAWFHERKSRAAKSALERVAGEETAKEISRLLMKFARQEAR